MGHWGTAISSNDTFMEVYETFFHYYNSNYSVDEIKKQVQVDFAGIISMDQAANDFWFAYAKALWECKSLDKDTFSKVKSIVDTGLDLKVWRELAASDKDLKARKIVLDKFVQKIAIEKEKAKARRKIKLYSGFYEKGACLAFKMNNGNYGGLVVLEKEVDTLEGGNYVAATNINSGSVPVLSDFLEAKILTGRNKETDGTTRYEHFWIFAFEARDKKKYNKNIEQYLIPVGVLTIKGKFERYFETPFQYCENYDRAIGFVQDSLEKIHSGEKENISASVKEWIAVDHYKKR